MSEDLWYSVREENSSEPNQGSLKKEKKDKFDSFKIKKKKKKESLSPSASTTLRTEIMDELEEDPFGTPGFTDQFPKQPSEGTYIYMYVILPSFVRM